MAPSRRSVVTPRRLLTLLLVLVAASFGAGVDGTAGGRRHALLEAADQRLVRRPDRPHLPGALLPRRDQRTCPRTSRRTRRRARISSGRSSRPRGGRAARSTPTTRFRRVPGNEAGPKAEDDEDEAAPAAARAATAATTAACSRRSAPRRRTRSPCRCSCWAASRCCCWAPRLRASWPARSRRAGASTAARPSRSDASRSYHFPCKRALSNRRAGAVWRSIYGPAPNSLAGTDRSGGRTWPARRKQRQSRHRTRRSRTR